MIQSWSNEYEYGERKFNFEIKIDDIMWKENIQFEKKYVFSTWKHNENIRYDLTEIMKNLM